LPDEDLDEKIGCGKTGPVDVGDGEASLPQRSGYQIFPASEEEQRKRFPPAIDKSGQELKFSMPTSTNEALERVHEGYEAGIARRHRRRRRGTFSADSSPMHASLFVGHRR